MTDCDEVLREVELYLDGELEPERRTHVEEHLRTCDPCLYRAEFRRELKVLIARKCGGERVPEALVVRVRRVIETEG